MAIHHYRYSMWDGTQDIPAFSADELLEKMTDDLLRGGDPQEALRRLMERGFRLPDGRRFRGLDRLRQQMRQYRQDAFSRYDPSGVVDRIKQQLDEILGMERGEIDHRHEMNREQQQGDSPQSPPDDLSQSQGEQQSQEGASDSQPQSPSEQQTGTNQQSGMPSSTSGMQGGQQSPGSPGTNDQQPTTNDQQPAATSHQPPATDDFREMLDRMLQRKEAYLQQLPENNSGRIKGLREYDFLSPEAREAFDKLVGGMQRELMEQYFQGMKQGIGQITPQNMDAIRQMVRDLSEMLEASQRGDRGAFDRFMEQYGQNFPPGINSLEDLLEHLQRQASAMQALLDSMDPEQRAELQRMMDELLQDDRLRLDLARLGGNLRSMGYAPSGGGYPFRGDEAPGFGESLDMMRRLQAMQDLENAMNGGDPFNAVANAGGHDPSQLFGQGIGAQIQNVQDMAQSLLDAGYLKKEGEELILTARAVRKLGDASLREIFRKMKDDRMGGHTTPRTGQGGDITQQSRPYQFGDPFLVDIKSTVMSGVQREGPGTPVQLSPDDFAIFETERAVQHATVLVLDMSFSMYQNDLFVDAKKTALALESLIRGQFPRDALYIIGFGRVAWELNSDELPRLAENDYIQGTNYEMALMLARQLLSRHRSGNRQILFITDGEPTACMLSSGRIYFSYPPLPIVEEAALMEAARCFKEGITINTFMLNPYPRMIQFVEEMTAMNHGRMFTTGPYYLGEQVVLDYLNGRSVKHLK